LINKIDVFLLAAGESQRMFPLSQIMEKSLLPVDGIPVIRRITDNLINCDKIGKITICCLTKFKKQFEHEFRDIPSIQIVDMPKPMGTFSTFKTFTPSWERPSEWIMVHYADCLTEIDYNDFIASIDKKRDGIIAVTNTVKHDYSEVWIAKTGNTVLQFNEKPNITSYTWSGIGLFHVERIRTNYIYTAEPMDFAFDIFPQMIKKNKLGAYVYHGSWYDMGNLNSYRKVCASFGEK